MVHRIPEQLITPAIVDGASLAIFEKLLIRSLVALSPLCATYVRPCPDMRERRP